MESIQLFKVVVAGGRYFNDYSLLERKLDHLLANKLPHVQIVSGGAKGADALGERYATERGLSVQRFPADWSSHGRAAGPIRNRQMAQYADAVIVFWDGKSRGTQNMREEAQRLNLPLKTIYYKK